MKSSWKAFAWLLVASGLLAVSTYSLVAAFNTTSLTFTASASADTTISTFAPTTPQGTSRILRVSAEGTQLNMTLIQFNIAGKLRPSDLVIGAKMQLTLNDAKAESWPVTIATGRLLTQWSENATFKTRPLMVFDTTTQTPIGTNGAPARGTSFLFDVTKQMKRWQSYGGPSNFGTVLLIWDDQDASVGFGSRENTQLGTPSLQVTYLPGPTTIYGYLIDPGTPTSFVTRVD